MRRFSFLIVALLGLAACDPALGPLDTNAPREALAGSDLESRLSGRTLTMVPTDTGDLFVEATVVLNANKTAMISVGGQTQAMQWSINGQDLCFTRPGQRRDLDDCRTIGWIQGNRFAVFDRTLGNIKIADGVIR